MQTKQLTARWLLVVLAIGALGGCGGDSGPSAVLTTLTVSLLSSSLQPGQSTVASAAGLDQNNAAIATGVVQWSSSAPTVATVTASGVVAAIAPGSAQIIASAGSRTGVASLTVIPTPVASVVVTPTTASLTVGGTQQFTASTVDAAGAVLAGRSVTWSSADPTRVTVSASGLATAVAAGSTTISATSEGRAGTVNVVVAVPVCSQLRSIVVGQSVSSTLSNSDCRLTDGSYVQKYELRLTAQTAVTIDMKSTAIDSYLFLQNATTGAVIAQNDDDGGQRNARIEQLLPAGTYIVVANSFNAGEFGAFQLSVLTASAACFTAPSLTVPTAVNGTLRTTSCLLRNGIYTDRYLLNITTRTTLQLTMTSTAFDAYIGVLSQAGAVQGEDDDSGGGTNARLTITLDPGSYIVLATSFDSGVTGAYVLDVRAFAPPCAVSRSLVAGSTLSSTLTASDCVLDGGNLGQRWGLTLNAATQVRIDMTSTAVDAYLVLQDATTGTILLEDDDSAGGTNARLVASLPAGQYVVTATSYDPGEIGAYQISLGQAIATAITVVVSPSTATLQPGQTQQLTATLANTANLAVSWQSSAPGIASVNVNGQVRAVTAGSATITATSVADPLKSSTSRITVSPSATGTPNLDIAGVYVTQAIQTLDGRIPLVANRRALLRVFVRGSQAGLGTIPVRLRLYNGASVIATLTSNATPLLSIDESVGAAEFALTEAQVRNGLAYLADVDPSALLAETNETDNSFPLSGTPQLLNIQTVPEFRVVLLPIRFSKNSRTGAANVSLLNHARTIWPLATVISSVGATLTTDLPPLVASDANGSWSELLRQLELKRQLDGSISYYFGVLNVDYTSGLTGLAYVGGKTGIGIDINFAAGTNYPGENTAHELGHNFGRTHTPCFTGNNRPANPDPQYPFADGRIGAYGVDLIGPVLTRYLPTAPDIMGYCDKGWASPYTWNAVSVYRAAVPGRITQPAKPSVLITGMIRDGEVRVDPAFSTVATPAQSDPNGTHIAEARNASGTLLGTMRFTPLESDHSDTSTRAFVVAMPLSAAQQADVVSLVVRAVNGRQKVAQRSRLVRPPSLSNGNDDLMTVRPIASGEMEVAWQRGAIAAVAVRDRRTGVIVAFGSSGTLTLTDNNIDAMEFLISDGVSSVVQSGTTIRRKAP